MKKQYPITALCACLLIGLLMSCGCGTKWQQRRCRALNCCPTIKDSIHIRDSVYLVPVEYSVNPDTAQLDAYLECDSVNRVVLHSFNVVNGKYIRLVQEIQDGHYRVVSYLPGRVDTVYGKGHDRIMYRDRVQQVEVNKLTWWQRVQCGAFWPLAIIVLLVVVYIAYRIYKWIRSRFRVIPGGGQVYYMNTRA